MAHWYQQHSCSPLWLHKLNRKVAASHRKSCLSSRKRARTGPDCLPAGFLSTSAGTWCCYSWYGSSQSASPGPPSASAGAAPLHHLEGRVLTKTDRCICCVSLLSCRHSENVVFKKHVPAWPRTGLLRELLHAPSEALTEKLYTPPQSRPWIVQVGFVLWQYSMSPFSASAQP